MSGFRPLVSVCMVTYNHAPFIAQAIEGVLMQQTGFPFQLVIGEDASTDATRSICEDFSRRFGDRILLLDREPNLGMMKNFLRVLDHCSGKYVAICDGDDFWTDPLKLQRQVEYMESHPECVLHFTNAAGVDENGEIIQPILLDHKKQDFYAEDFFKPDNPVRTLTALFRFDKSIPVQAITPFPLPDIALWTLIMERENARCRFDPSVTAAYRYHGGGIFSSNTTLRALDRMIVTFELFKKKYPRHLSEISDSLVQLEDRKLKNLIESKQKKEFIRNFIKLRIGNRTSLSIRDALYLIRHS